MSTADTLHDPDRCMADLRQVLSQGKKQIGLLIGAGAAASIRRKKDGRDQPLIPTVEELTKSVVGALDTAGRQAIDGVKQQLGDNPNIEAILTKVRQLAAAIGPSKVHNLDSKGFDGLAEDICKQIGIRVKAQLPTGPSPYADLVGWIVGARRDSPVEIFTPNYDLLIEEALERQQAPYFDGFVGSHRPFFHPASVLTDELRPRWTLLWKLHGSLGWRLAGDSVVRTGQRSATALIYPEHLKYEQVGRLPYSALFERLRAFLTTPDTLLLCTGFSFSDAHILAVLDEGLTSNAHPAIMAFQFGKLEGEQSAVKMATRRPNMSVYARDGAVIGGVAGQWKLGELRGKNWQEIRKAFWQDESSHAGPFVLGDFSKLAGFLALTRSPRVESTEADVFGEPKQAEGETDASP